MVIGVRSVLRKIVGMLRTLVRVGAHISVRGGSSGGKGGRICRRAASVRDVVIVLGMVGEDLRRVIRFVGVWGSKIHIPWGVGVSLAIHDAIRSGVSFVDIGLGRSSGRVRWSHSPAE